VLLAEAVEDGGQTLVFRLQVREDVSVLQRVVDRDGAAVLSRVPSSTVGMTPSGLAPSAAAGTA
jgi:hypothetical protein